MTKVYVAASSRELDRAKAAIAALTDRGYHVTHNWPAEVEKVGEANPRNATRKECAGWAAEDLNGVYAADILWVLVPPDHDSFGAGVEVGAAVTKGLTIVFSGDFRRSIFTTTGYCFDRDDQALEAFFPDSCDCRDCVRAQTTCDLKDLEGMN